LFILYSFDPTRKAITPPIPPIRLIIPLALLLNGSGVKSGIRAMVGDLKEAMTRFRRTIDIISETKLQ
jgi:hypothetical protein